MRNTLISVAAVLVPAVLVAVLAVALRREAMPLGVAGEWEWLRLPAGVHSQPVDLVLGLVAVSLFAIVAAVGASSLAVRSGPAREVAWVGTVVVAAVAVQAAVQSSAPTGYGLAKWVMALSQQGSSGYFLIARSEARDLGRFLAEYPIWIRRQDALHIGTHPPGLIAVEAVGLRVMEAHPALAQRIVDAAPTSAVMMWRVLGTDIPSTRADRATLLLTGSLTLLACASTVAPLYLLARSALPAGSSLAAAALWVLAPSAVLFQPAADTAFPLLSTTALALAAHAGSAGTRLAGWLAATAGVVLGVGMQFSLVFLAVGLVAGLVMVASPGRSWKVRLGMMAATGTGFLLVTFAVWAATRGNPFVTWWWNQANHARFYDEFHRSYRAWVVANPAELAVGLGLPTAAWALASVGWPRGVPRPSVAAAAVLVVLTLSGRSLSEVGRLWLPLMPPLIVAAGYTFDRLRPAAWTVAVVVGLVGVQALTLQTMIQVVYPV